MKIEIKKARMSIHMTIGRFGSVLGQTMRAKTYGFDVKMEIESEASPEEIAGVLRNAENACFAEQAILQPTPIRQSLVLNGKDLSLDDFAPPALPER